MDTIKSPRLGKVSGRSLKHVPATNRVATMIHVRSAFTKACKVVGVKSPVTTDVFHDGYQAFINDVRIDHGTDGLHAPAPHQAPLRVGRRVVGYKNFFVKVLSSTEDGAILVDAVK